MKGAVVTLVWIAMVVTSACRVATVRRLDDQGVPAEGAAAERPFDAVALVDSAWRSELVPALAAAQDASAIAGGGASPAPSGERAKPVIVRGRGRVVEVDTRSRTGTATIGLDGGAVVLLQLGPVLTGTALRDALPSLDFDRFVNQIQHADVGNELNARVEQGLLKQLDRAGLRGRHVSFAGVASFEAGRPVTITPVRLELEPRP